MIRMTWPPPGLILIGLLAVPFALFSTYWGAPMVGLHEIALLRLVAVVPIGDAGLSQMLRASSARGAEQYAMKATAIEKYSTCFRRAA